jgi:hypothetical protein
MNRFFVLSYAFHYEPYFDAFSYMGDVNHRS